MQNSNRHPHGFGITPRFDCIPLVIRGGHWCVWKAIPKVGKDGKYDKTPHNGQYALSTASPRGWLTFDQAVAVYQEHPDLFNGIGRLVEKDGLTFIDVDQVQNIDMYTRSMPTYWEMSPSGKGIRGVSLGTASRDIQEPVEIYSGHAPRFVTITGNVICDSPPRDLTAPLESWIERATQESVKPDIAPRPAITESELPFPLNTQHLDRIPIGCTDRSQELMKVTVRLLSNSVDRQLAYSFFTQSVDWMQTALDHRHQNEDKAHDYLWTTILKADAWVKKHSPQGEYTGYFKRVAKPWTALEDEMKLEPPRFNSDHWPALLRDYAQEISINTGADPLAPAFAGLWSLSACIDHRSTVEVWRGWSEKLIIWACLIGNPSTMKTPATRPFTEMLVKMENEFNAMFQAQMEAYDRAQARFQSQNREEQEGEVVAQAAPRPVRPIALRLVINDGTGQGMRDVLTERPRGCAVFFDEMSDFLHRQTQAGRDNPDRGFWLQGFNGGKHSTALAGRGYIDVSNIAMPMFGNVQPNVLQPMGRNLKADGLIQRFIPVALRRTKLPQLDKQLPEFMSRAGEWEQLLRYYLMQQPFTLTFSRAAQERLHAYSEWLFEFVDGLSDLHWSEGHTTALGKSRGLLARLASLFHIIERRDGYVVGDEDMARAERLMREYIIPAQSHLYNELFGLGQETFRIWLLDTVLTHQKEQRISLREIKRLGKRRPELEGSTRLRDETVMSAMDDLEAHKIVSPDLDSAHDPRSRVWHVNPEVLQDMAERVQKRKELHRWVLEQIDLMKQSRTDDDLS